MFEANNKNKVLFNFFLIFTRKPKIKFVEMKRIKIKNIGFRSNVDSTACKKTLII